MLFILRRFALVLVVTSLSKFLFAQISILVFFSTIQVAYLTTFKPNEDSLMHKLELFNELTTVLLVDLLTIFSAGNLHKFDFEADIGFIGILICFMLVHVFFLVKSSVIEAKKKCRKKGKKSCCCFFSKKKVAVMPNSYGISIRMKRDFASESKVTN